MNGTVYREWSREAHFCISINVQSTALLTAQCTVVYVTTVHRSSKIQCPLFPILYLIQHLANSTREGTALNA